MSEEVTVRLVTHDRALLSPLYHDSSAHHAAQQGMIGLHS
jgi:hypothetical protein